MESKVPNYCLYTVNELREALEFIDKDKLPDRVEVIKNELVARQHGKKEPTKVTSVEAELPTPKKSVKWRLIIIAMWLPLLVLSVYYGKLPAKGEGVIEYSESPGFFWLIWSIYLGIGIYFYNLDKNND